MKLSIPQKIDAQKFREKIGLICDPYFDREFFTNLIYCADRGKSIRDVFEAALDEVSRDPSKGDLDASILHFFYTYQTSSVMRENYQWLPLAQGIYGTAIQRGDGQKQVYGNPRPAHLMPKAISPAEFESAIKRDVRKVESKDAVWQGLLFLLENRTTRAQAIKAMIREAVFGCDPLSFELIVKGFDLSLSSGWRSQHLNLLKPFERFWTSASAPEVALHGFRLAKSQPLKKNLDAGSWRSEWTEDLWKIASSQGAEATWARLNEYADAGVSIEQLFAILGLLRGRTLFSMMSDQWPRVAASLVYGEALQSAARWVPEDAVQFLAISAAEFSKLAQALGSSLPARPVGQNILDGVSKNISKDRLILRLDDCVEQGQRTEALELMAVILNDEGLSHSVSDRLLLVASKQDSWTYHMRTIPVAYVVTRTFDQCRRLGISGEALADSMFGLLRFLSDQRDVSLAVVEKTGTYGDGLFQYQGQRGIMAKIYGHGGLSRSEFDVSGGARIVDRFVFNQMRNAQRVKVWPSDN